MRDEKVFRVGRLIIHGERIEFAREAKLEFAAARGEPVAVGLQFDYREASEDEETAHIRFTAQIDGQPEQVEEIVIRDHPVVNDSRRGFVRIPIRVGTGTSRGRFHIHAKYGAGPWREAPEVVVEGGTEGAFEIRVT